MSTSSCALSSPVRFTAFTPGVATSLAVMSADTVAATGRLGRFLPGSLVPVPSGGGDHDLSESAGTEGGECVRGLLEGVRVLDTQAGDAISVVAGDLVERG